MTLTRVPVVKRASSLETSRAVLVISWRTERQGGTKGQYSGKNALCNMPCVLANTIACPRCHRLGTIRQETVIHAADSSVAFSCSVCGHEWKAQDHSFPPASVARPPKKPACH